MQLLSTCRRQLWRRDQRQDGASALYVIAYLDLRSRRSVEQHIHAGAELDQADAFSAGHSVPHSFVEHNPSSQQPGDLLKDHRLPFAFDSDHVLFILVRRGTRSSH